MKGIIGKIEGIIGEFRVMNKFVKSNEKTPLKYLSEIEFIDGLNDKTLIPESLNLPLLNYCSLFYRHQASSKRFLRKREFYYTDTQTKLTDSVINFDWLIRV